MSEPLPSPPKPTPAPSAARGGLRVLWGDPLWRALLVLSGATAFALLLVVARASYTGRPTYNFLVWNLFLAWVPAGFAVATSVAVRRPRGRVVAGLFVLGWLAFFPNGPYILTDLMHLRTTFGGPLWFDLLMVLTTALAALLVSVISLRMVHRSVDRLVRPRWIGWALIIGACFAGGFGVYLGRFLRFNSWDLVIRPGDVLGDAVESISGARGVGFSIGFGALVLFVYGVVVALGHPNQDSPRESAATAPPTQE